MQSTAKWKRLSRKVIHSDPFISLFSDEVQFPNGTIIPDYSVVKKPDYVLIIATTPEDNVIVMKEYKYAVDEFLWTVPAGHLEKNESPIEAAKRELLEETGYSSDSISLLTTLFEFPTKDAHTAYVVRAQNCLKKKEQQLEETESISEIVLCSPSVLKEQVKRGEWKAASVIAGFSVSGLI